MSQNEGQYSFFAFLSRMRHIYRWSLMRNVTSENIQEHSLQVAMIAHGLALIKNRLFQGAINAERVALLAIFHDSNETITGDLPTPIKYFNPEIKMAYKQIERVAEEKLVDMLPEALKGDYESLILDRDAEAELYAIVKAADKICAYLKCVEELSAGNSEFEKAKNAIEKTIKEMDRPEVNYFMETFVPSFELTLDELN